MNDQSYKASKSRSQNRPGWSISFRHPLRNDSRGKPGLKMRRGLGTDAEDQAAQMVEEMNAILGDQAWWSALKRTEAENRFSKPVVKAFYDEIQAGREAPEKLRDRHITLPSAADGYSKVLFVGTTGAGKTSLLRQIIGSDPDEDRFPSTAPAKTTIADIEVVQSDGSYKAVVTFFSEFQVQAYIEECVAAACIATFEGASDARVAERLLHHSDQKFRLNYVLGTWQEEPTQTETGTDDDFSFDDDEKVAIDAPATVLTPEEKLRNREALRTYVERIRNVTGIVVKSLSDQLGENVARLTGADKDAAEELFEFALSQRDDFSDLVHDLLEEVKQRFEYVAADNLVLGPSGWPELWMFESDDRAEFIRHIRWFSSNYWPEFGRLLTPIVQGIRVRGPLYPVFDQTATKLVLIDGQGLGHTPDSSSSVTTHITRLFPNVDVILLVDNAQQPMQAAPLSVLRAVASSGHHSKLAVAFTHFDQIKGKSLPSFSDKRAHVMASVTNALASLKDVLGAPVAKAIERGIEERCFMLGGVDRRLDNLPGKASEYMRTQLSQMIAFFQRAILPPPPPEARPIYDPTGMGFAIREAVIKFSGPWLARLGLATHNSAHREHWTRIKALNRRIAGELDLEYDSLKPVADLVSRLTESISLYLDKPFSWTRSPNDEQEADAAISNIRRGVSLALHEVAVKRLVEQHLGDWRTAYDSPEYRGTGSTYKRALMLRHIYDEAAPLPDTVMTQSSLAFLAEIRGIVETSIDEAGGTICLETFAERKFAKAH